MDVKTYWTWVLVASVAKLLMLKSYRSTDFEVHRNWMALTSSLPMDKWYYEDTSEWTLDYPPFFAYFEWVLSVGARFFDPDMLDVTNLNYASSMTVLYQKLTVIVADLVLAFGVLECSKVMPGISSSGRKRRDNLLSLLILVFANGGLFLVDHIHFQYNGFLFGILLLSIAKMCSNEYYTSAVLFASLLCFKHIFLYVAPAFGVFLLRKYCVNVDKRSLPQSINFKPLLGLGSIVILVTTAAFGPFYKHIPQILRRLFPFGRGLSHAYWAPNLWSLYNSLDLALSYVMKVGKGGVTSGLVEESKFAVLPQVQPIHTFVLTLVVMLPIVWKLWQTPSHHSFVTAVTLTTWTSFMFGYHVHEKAILNVLLPFSLISFYTPELFLLTLITGTFSLFPLLFTPFEIVLKALVTVFHIGVSTNVLNCQLNWWQQSYLLGFIPVYVFENLGYLIVPKLPFLPLLVVSDYCFVGLTFCYLALYRTYLCSKDGVDGRDKDKHLDSAKVVSPSSPTQNSLSSSTRVLRSRKK